MSPACGRHVYFFFAEPDAGESPVARRTAFMAPADGTVQDVIPHAPLPDVKVTFRASATVTFYIDHLIPAVPLGRGTRVTAGQQLGTTGTAYAIDLGVVNESLTLGFVNPSRYPQSVHTDAPLKYYEEPLRSQLYAKVTAIGSDLDGKIDFDVAGRLTGNWFAEGDATPLAFAYNNYDPTQVRISLAGGLSLVGVFAIAGTDPAPRDVSVGSGKVRYTLTRAQTGPPITGGPIARMLVEMIDGQRIRAETFSLSASADDFTGAAKVFVR